VYYVYISEETVLDENNIALKIDLTGKEHIILYGVKYIFLSVLDENMRENDIKVKYSPYIIVHINIYAFVS